MKSKELESWALEMAAHNPNPFDWITPVLLYRNGIPSLTGAYVRMDDNTEVVFTAGHGFSIDYPPFVWSFRKLIPVSTELRSISKATPMRDADDDVAICTPASVLQTSIGPLPNFYKGLRRGNVRPTIEFLSPLKGTVRSVLTGEDVRLLGEATIDGKLHVGLDVKASEGQSGSVFVDEVAGKIYILRMYIPALSQRLRERNILEHGVSFAIRLAFE